MEANYCLKCMEKLSAGETVCPHCGYDNKSTEMERNTIRPGSIARGRYLIGKPLGRGGFGITYIARDLILDVKVAIKEYFPSGIVSRDSTHSNNLRWDTGKGMITQSDGCEDFLKEARKMALLERVPSIVQVRDMFLENETAYIVMEYVDGENLRDYLKRTGVMEIHECVRLLAPMIRDLEQVHKHNLIHRDISPDNIMLRPDGSLCLLDLGAAKDLSIQRGQSSMVVAKSGFSPLEQYSSGSQIGPWTDVYALCATIYYCVTGKVLPTAIDRMMDGSLSFEGAKTPISETYRAVLTQGLAVSSENRIQSASALLEKLEKAMDGGQPKKEKTPEPARKPKKSSGMALVVCLVMIMLAFLSAAAVIVFTDGSDLEKTLISWLPWSSVPDDPFLPENPVSQDPILTPTESMAPGETEPGFTATLPPEVTGAKGGALTEEMIRDIQTGLTAYWNTNYWQKKAPYGAQFKINAGAYYYAKDFQGYKVKAVLLRVDGLDIRDHGMESNIILIELGTGNVYYKDNINLESWGQFRSRTDAYSVCVMSYANVLLGINRYIWADWETLKHFSGEELQTLNDGVVSTVIG